MLISFLRMQSNQTIERKFEFRPETSHILCLLLLNYRLYVYVHVHVYHTHFTMRILVLLKVIHHNDDK